MTRPDQQGRQAASFETERLQGGVNEIIRSGDTVIRPAGRHTATVHRLLLHVRRRCSSVPEPLSHDRVANTETLSFVAGRVTGHPISDEFRTDRALTSAAQLLRRYHDATVDFEPSPTDAWDLRPQQPAEVVCHGDFAPYNCVVNDGEVTGVFDFDTAHPGPRLWDLGYAAYRWVPMLSPTNPNRALSDDEQRRRLRMFCLAYQTAESPNAVVAAAADRLDALVATMRHRAAGGNRAFARHIAEGHDIMYQGDINHLRELSAERYGR